MPFRPAKRFRRSRRPRIRQRSQKRIFYGLVVAATAVAALFVQTL
jgi:hypothetical protein